MHKLSNETTGKILNLAGVATVQLVTEPCRITDNTAVHLVKNIADSANCVQLVTEPGYPSLVVICALCIG